jgi:hypothetical protein
MEDESDGRDAQLRAHSDPRDAIDALNIGGGEEDREEGPGEDSGEDDSGVAKEELKKVTG